MCPECGFYKGRMVIDMAAKKDAREARLKAKEEMRKAQQGFDEADEAAPTQETETAVEETPVEEAPETNEEENKQ